MTGASHGHIGGYEQTSWRLMRSVSKLVNIHVDLTWKITIRSGHNFAHVMTAQLSWHVQNYDLIGSSESWIKQKTFLWNFNDELVKPSWDGAEESIKIWHDQDASFAPQANRMHGWQMKKSVWYGTTRSQVKNFFLMLWNWQKMKTTIFYMKNQQKMGQGSILQAIIWTNADLINWSI